ncbi:MAG: HD domain-containing protein [Anaerolineae bacterium]|nr:HD domain-containing protein [Anaerolineae bacterium]
MNISRSVYRVRQFWLALVGKPQPGQLDQAGQLLSPQQFELFQKMQASEQAHALHVLQQLQAQGHQEPDLLAAALLHDVGKVQSPLRIWQRVLIVLSTAIAPRWVLHWGRGAARGWRRPFVVAAQHPQWGAQMAAQAGLSALAVRLILRHQERLPADAPAAHDIEDRLLRKLQAADNES